VATDNKGNEILQRTFIKRGAERLNGIDQLCQVLKKKPSTAYQMTEPVGEYETGRRSPLYVVCELVRARHLLDVQEKRDVPLADELAAYPLAFLHDLRGAAQPGDPVHQLGQLLRCVTNVIYMAKGRALSELTLGELTDYTHEMLEIQTLAGALGQAASRMAATQAASYHGVPQIKERRTGS
jgi:hypothetical protein